jgi:uncharacterized protein (TIGR02996 family)
LGDEIRIQWITLPEEETEKYSERKRITLNLTEQKTEPERVKHCLNPSLPNQKSQPEPLSGRLPVTDLSDLIRAVVENPEEDTPVSMLADHLLEKGDGRGEILRRWLTGEQRVKFPHAITDPDITPHHKEKTDDYGINTLVRDEPVIGTSMDGSRHQVPLFSLYVDGGEWKKWKGFHVKVPDQTDARQLADTLPHAYQAHAFLDSTFGPDPRTKLADGLNKVLKDRKE